ncbi:hypothetical protein LUX12_09370 [Streptomyces somaliensis]|uniref:hypothetical protein n=1 Tax=Streptomyces somaliensis TaxID=78355 RepID=UPI0020CD26A1|nr:hypothetical protein [Streptomyces somaliensis]MCP9944938.1 hypothetical protein [Streptomyces somaliensis]MCP9961839.1 hypothetical protein [Streptomyces somaliensis]MCP9974659.1 hypothetical protein [Streptomyces somaliensis]
MPLRIAVNDSAALRARCDMAEARAAMDEPEFEDGAVIPGGLWQPLTKEAERGLIARAGTPSSTLVEIVRPPLPTGDNLNRLAAPMGDEDARYLGQALAEPGMLTTTDNYRDGRLIGLHLDNWDKLPYGRKPFGRRRLALNLGPGTRYIILGDLDAQAVCRTVHPQDFADRHPHTDDYRTYVAAGHPVRCFRVRLDPGEGYIAPTEYLLHDGSTEGADKPSAVAFWLGRWPPGTLPSLV